MVRDELKELGKSEALHEKRTKVAEMLHSEVALSLFPVKGGMPDVCRVQLKEADSNYFTKIMEGEAFDSPDKKRRSELRPVDVLVLEHHAWTRHEMELKRGQFKKEGRGGDDKFLQYLQDVSNYIFRYVNVQEYKTNCQKTAMAQVLNQGKGLNVEEIDVFKARVCSELTSDDTEMSTCQDKFDSLMGDADARKATTQAALLLAEAATPKKHKENQRLDAYMVILKREKPIGMMVFGRVKRAKQALAGLKAGRNDVLMKQVGHKPCTLTPKPSTQNTQP